MVHIYTIPYMPVVMVISIYTVYINLIDSFDD